MARPRSSLPLLVVLTAVIPGCGSAEPSPDPVVARGGDPPGLPAGADGGVLVDVAGLVRRPGVYRLPPGARVHEAIAAAGGVRPRADLGALNRAAPLVDGQQVRVGAVGGSGTTSAGSGATAGSPVDVSINSADAAALDALPGIGPVTAERIVAARDEGGPFASLDDLDRVPGIGPATIEALRDVATT